MSKGAATAEAPWVRDGGNAFKRKMYGGEVAFGVFQTHENCLRSGSLLMQITFTSTPRMSTQEFQSRLRAAWLAIRFQTHPLVACTATSPSNKLDTTGYWLHYPLVDGITATVWANETVICHDHTTGSGLAASLKDAAKTADGSDNNSRAVLHFAPDPVVEGCFHLLFSSGHWITDGRGVFKMFDQMLAILNEEQSDFDSGAKKYAWGEEVKRLSVPLSVAMGQRQARDGDLLPESDEELGAFVKVLMEKEAEADPVFSGPVSNIKPVTLPVAMPDVTSSLNLSTADTSALLASCRAHGVTMTTLFFVLIAIGFVDRSPTGRADLARAKTFQYPFFSVFRGDDLIDRWKDSLGLGIVLAPVTIDAHLIETCLSGPQDQEESIWQAARSAMEQVVAGKKVNQVVKYDHEVVDAMLPKLLGPDGSNYLLSGLPFMTSIGRITPLISSSPPDARWKASEPMNGWNVRWSRLTLHLWEWEGRSTLLVVGSSQYQRQEELDRFVEVVRKAMDRVLSGKEGDSCET